VCGLRGSADSQGVVRAMVPGWNYRWTPIAHLGKEASEHEKLAVIGVVLKPDFQHVLCVPYKKARKHPVVLPKPLPKIVAATLDLKDSGGYGAPLQLLIKQQMLVQAEKLAENHGDYDGANAMRTGHDMSLAKLVMQLIKHDQAAKALALCEFANNRVMMYNTAAKVANAFNKSLVSSARLCSAMLWRSVVLSLFGGIASWESACLRRPLMPMSRFCQ
jgi:hypothetical protein